MRNFNGTKLRELIEGTGENLLAFSKTSQLNRTQLEFASHGYRPSEALLQKICDYFNVPADYFDDAAENPTTIDLQRLIRESGKKLVEISAEANVSEVTLRMIVNSTSYAPSEKNAAKLYEVLCKKEAPLTYLDKQLAAFADERFEGDLEKAKEYILHFYFDLQNLNV